MYEPPKCACECEECACGGVHRLHFPPQPYEIMSILSYDYYGFSAASNSSNGNAAAAYSQLNGGRNNDALGSPSSLTSISKPNGSSPAGRQSASSATGANTSSSSSSSSLVHLNSPQTSTSQANGGGSSARSTSSNNLLQQLEYNHAFTTAASTTANTSSASGALNYHAAGQLSHQLNSTQSPHSQSTNLSTAGHTSIHNAHHHSTSNNIFSNSHAHHHHSNSHHHSNTNNSLVLYNNDLPDTKEGLDELCPVCGDKVSENEQHLFICYFFFLFSFVLHR